MIRKFLFAMVAFGAALAASACSYGSAVDVAPYNARVSKPVIAAGDYCEVQGTAKPFTVVSNEDCVPITWNQQARAYTMVDLEDPEESVTANVVSMGLGLYLAQMTVETDKPDKYQILVFIAKGDAFATLSALDDEPLQKLTEKHRRLTFAKDATGRPYVSAGKPGHIKAFLKDAAKETLRQMKAEDEPVSVGVLDKAGAPIHEASKQQAKDIEAILKLAKSLTPK
ncbi:MAG: hypothetical protein Q8R02_07965 [Hyphomonadaceae bacterium]|nr:hypothetical protein [Hyphomonadaceae bacterium]